jgi:diguanylate cyclase (GGDEF)-like protein
MASFTLFFRRTLAPLFFPGVLILVPALILWHFPDPVHRFGGTRELGALFTLLPFLPYVVLCITAIMGWRYNNTGMLLAALFLGFAYRIVGLSGWGQAGNPAALITAVLFPLDLLLFSLLVGRRPLSIPGLAVTGLVVLQGFWLALVTPPKSGFLTGWIYGRIPGAEGHLVGTTARFVALVRSTGRVSATALTTAAVAGFFVVGIYLLIRFFRSRDARVAGFLGVLGAVFACLVTGSRPLSPILYFSAAGIILIVAGIETSFSMAYNDELTGLPGRRSLNEALVNLGRKYAIGMLDVDHFKRFNDTYGHDTGDQVLKLIAKKLTGLSGGAKTFRYGGEEFTAIFPGKDVDEAILYLERYRKDLERTPFMVRGKGRKTGSAKNRGRTGGRQDVRITVSIGVAGPGKGQSEPNKVLKAADKALYRAKKGGRNQVRE